MCSALRASLRLFQSAPDGLVPQVVATATIFAPARLRNSPVAAMPVRFAGLARISHRLPAARPDTLAVTVRTRCGRLDVVSATPSPPSAACASPHRRLEPLATENGEICGLPDRIELPELQQSVAVRLREGPAAECESGHRADLDQCVRSSSSSRLAGSIVSSLFIAR
jgi:hypothetical protein